MNPTMKFDPTDTVSVIEYLSSLDTPESVLENSLAIYSTDVKTKKDVLENTIRYGNLSIDQLSDEKHKLNALIQATVEHNIPMSDSLQTYVVEMNQLVDTRILQESDINAMVDNVMVDVYEGTLAFNEDVNYPDRVNQSVTESTAVIFETLDNNTMISSIGLYEACNALVDPKGCIPDEQKDQCFQSLLGKIKKTLKYEFFKPEFEDLPMIHALGASKNKLKTCYKDKPDVSCKIDELFDKLSDGIEDMLRDYFIEASQESGYIPNPFSLNNLTPMPVGTRTVTRSIMDITTADTDEALEEALLNFARINNVCEHCSDLILEGRNTVLHKATRKMAKGSQKAASKLTKVKKDGDDIKNNLKKTKEPMQRFIEDTINKMKQSDSDERRLTIIKGGTIPKLLHYIKRVGIPAVVAGVAVSGPVSAVVAASALLTTIATNKVLDKREKNKILAELEQELAIVNEKIDDSRGDDDKSKKYELIRIKNQLEKDIKRIQLGLKYDGNTREL